jgi:hypothetical protein
MMHLLGKAATAHTAATLLTIVVLGSSPPSALAQDNVTGKWGPKMKWPNVAIHVNVLPNGKVLFWGRREWNTDNDPPTPKGTLDPRESTPRVWDPVAGGFSETANKPGFNLFCSGHAFLADGRLLVVGGHIEDGKGEPRATIYDPSNNKWKEVDQMNRGRWYPTAVSLADGRVVVSSGSDENNHINPVQQVFGKDEHWKNIVDFVGLPLYPRMHVAPDGRVLMSGLNLERVGNDRFQGTYLLDVDANGGAGDWTRINAPHLGPLRDYYPSVMYDVGKVIVIGGGNKPRDDSETIDLNQSSPKWESAGKMFKRRRQHDATILPDGTVLVTGGTQGEGFNNLTTGSPIRSAEVWDPKTRKFTKLARMDVDRCYHATAVLLPDATVLAAGGGEYKPDGHHENPHEDSHLDAQIFSPPYLFRGSRPVITNAQAEDATFGGSFKIDTPDPGSIKQVNCVKLSSVTHAFNPGQRFASLKFVVDGASLKVTAPASGKVCPPGHYMLFILNEDGVPSKAKMMRFH